MSEFKVGDEVEILSSCSGCNKGEMGILKMGNKDDDNVDEMFAITSSCLSGDGCSCSNRWKLIKKSIRPKLKVGDEVRIVKRGLDLKDETRGCCWIESMDQYNGAKTIITKISSDGKYIELRNGGGWSYVEEWLDLVGGIPTMTNDLVDSTIFADGSANYPGVVEIHSRFKVGDRVVVDGCIDGLNLTGRIATIKWIDEMRHALEFDEKVDGLSLCVGHNCGGKTKDGYGWNAYQGDLKSLKLLKANQNKNMSSIVKFVKNLTLSADERLLREMGFKDECGDYTEEAKEIAINKLLDDSQAHLVDIATKLKAEKKEKKACKTC